MANDARTHNPSTGRGSHLLACTTFSTGSAPPRRRRLLNRPAEHEAATEKAKELANEMSNAATIEAQTASQGLVLGLMNYNPGFSAYANAIIPDTGAVEMARQYNKPTVDNRRALRALSGASDRLHQEMVDEQYR